MQLVTIVVLFLLFASMGAAEDATPPAPPPPLPQETVVRLLRQRNDLMADMIRDLQLKLEACQLQQKNSQAVGPYDREIQKLESEHPGWGLNGRMEWLKKPPE